MYNTCEWCGANLDPAERCDCQGAGQTIEADFIHYINKKYKQNEITESKKSV